MKEIGSFLKRLSSRKFLLTTAGIVLVTLYPEQTAAITTLIGIFVGGEGAADVVSRYAVEKTAREQAKVEVERIKYADDTPDDVDTSVIVAGDAPL